MIRLILRLLGIRDFEVCKSCETLKQMLEYERDINSRLETTLINIVNPKIIEAQAPVEINPIMQTSALFSRRRAALEAADRQAAAIKKNSPNIGKPDDRLNEVNKLERELGISDGSDLKRAEEGV